MDHMSSELYMIVFSNLCQPFTIYIHIFVNLGKVIYAMPCWSCAFLFCILGTGICERTVMLICTVTPALH